MANAERQPLTKATTHPVAGEGQESPDVVEEVASRSMQGVRIEAGERSWLISCHRWLPGKADLGELAQVLGGGGEVEFISGTVGAA